MDDHSKAVAQIAQGSEAAPAHMKMVVQSGMLKTLGINLYTSIGKVLVEFIANAYDSDATKIDISLPYERIAAERDKLRKEMKTRREEEKKAEQHAASDVAEHPNGSSDGVGAAFEMLAHTLPEEVQILLRDDGHGMSTNEVETRFLPLNRNRRTDPKPNLMTEGGKRFVMGRKGLGKLAGFGVAQKVKVWTKRRGQTHATIITMDDEEIEGAKDVGSIKIPVTYERELDPELHGTTITFSVLKSDAFREQKETIEKSIRSSFNAIRPEDFAIRINDEILAPAIPDYEFVYPESLTLEGIRRNELAEDSVQIEDLGEMKFRYYVGFRKRKEHLAAKERGARIYCNNRLAAGPTLFDLGTGMHSFHSQDYMECVVEADDLDRGSVDIINTSRTQFKEGSDLIGTMASRLAEIMKAAIARHGRFREQVAEDEIHKDPEANVVNRIIEHLPRKTRQPAKKLLTMLAAEYGVGTPQFNELAPIVVHSVNATDVLSRLITLGSKPETLDRIASSLRELAEIEKVDALKHYRGRRSGIQALLTLEEKGEQQWNKKQTEKELHGLFKVNPWLIRPEYANYLASDEDMNKVVSKLAKVLGVDKFAAVVDDEGNEDETRPDLVFLVSDPLMSAPHVLNVIELKSVSKPLTYDHYRQLEEYLFKIGEWCQSEMGHAPAMHGYLIGAMPDTSATAVGQKMLLKKFLESTPKDQIRIIGIRQLIKDALAVHLDAIKTLEQDLNEDEVDDGSPIRPSSETDNDQAAKLSAVSKADNAA
ncbi:ATP-binding protein [Mesorhizobium sp. B2-3-5]|uniref:ATP-binding protein n=1 Tax=Mesorhizobium sp. B2-3-5 TaxID=2589958 RepID=UPI0015E30ED0|nr:ATP-binding protein [Mesorhizobium sp. B2-3-5]